MRNATKLLAGGIISAALFTGGLVQANEDLAKKHACLACHQIDKKVVGPAYKEVAAKYKGADDAQIAALADKVMKGGAGVWGPIPMPPNANVTPEEATTLVKWVLSMAEEAAPAAAAPAAEAEAKTEEAAK